MADFIFDDYPTIIIKYKKNFGSALEQDNYRHILSQILKSRTDNKIKILFDASKCNRPPIKYVIDKAKYMITHEPFIKHSVNKTAIILPSDSWKYYINIIFKIKKPSKPCHVTLSQDDAIAFLNSDIIDF
jgi:hypothetical protein